MLENTISIDLGAETGIALTRVNQDNYSSTYFGEATNVKIRFNVKHDIPARGRTGESHLARLDVEHYSAEGEYLRTSSAWTVIKTFDGIQDSAASGNAVAALNGIVDATFASKIIGQES